MKEVRPAWSVALWGVVAGVSAAVGCRSPAAEAPPVVVIQSPPPAPESTAAPTSAVEDAPSPPRKDLRGLRGQWEDMETRSIHHIAEVGGRYMVTAIDTADGEVVEIRSNEWKNGVLRWSYFVPSTGFLVHLTTKSVDGDTLWCDWSNATSSGEQEFQRVKPERE